MAPTKRMKHDYTNEIELKSLLIRERNKSLGTGVEDEAKNDYVDDLIRQYVNNRTPELKALIISESEKLKISKKSHEYFGKLVLLMTKKILTKSNFSGYTWYDEFFSDACFRVFKYLHNFDHTLRSKTTGQEVSAFAYISQIIHNSIVAIIKEKNKDIEQIEALTRDYNTSYGIENENITESTYDSVTRELGETYIVSENIVEDIADILSKTKSKDLRFVYPKGMFLSLSDYDKISELLKNRGITVSIVRRS